MVPVEAFCFIAVCFMLTLTLLFVVMLTVWSSPQLWMLNDLHTLFRNLTDTCRLWLSSNQNRQFIEHTQTDMDAITDQYLQEVRSNTRR